MSAGEPGGWRRVGGRPGGALVLAVDFDQAGRDEADFADLAANLQVPVELWQTVHPDQVDAPETAGQLLARWADRPAGDVRAVLGYCVGSVLAAEVAASVATQQLAPPQLILFDPEPMVVGSLRRDLGKAVRSLSVLTTEEQDAYLEECDRRCAAAADDVPRATVDVLALYDEAGRVAFDRLGLDDEFGDELLGVMHSYLSYLSASSHSDPAPAWAGATAVTSAASSPGAGDAAREIRFEVTSAALLQAPDVAAAVDRLLQSGT